MSHAENGYRLGLRAARHLTTTAELKKQLYTNNRPQTSLVPLFGQTTPGHILQAAVSLRTTRVNSASLWPVAVMTLS